jgi:hypothetical protein
MDTLLMRPGRKRHPERMVPLALYAPASIGNFSLGFDSLGLALAPVDGTLLGDLVQLSLPEYALPWPASELQEKRAGFRAHLPSGPRWCTNCRIDSLTRLSHCN